MGARRDKGREAGVLQRVDEVAAPIQRAAVGVGLICTGTPAGVAAGAVVLAAEGARLVANSFQDRWDAVQEVAQLRALRQRHHEAGEKAIGALCAENDAQEEQVRILRDALRAYTAR